MTELTVGDLVEQLKVFPNNARLDFSGLKLYRLKSRADDLVQIEFNEMVYRDQSGKVVVENL